MRTAAIADEMADFIARVATEPASHTNIEHWQHLAMQLANAYYQENHPCPVFMCSHCAGEREEAAAEAHEDWIATKEYSGA